MYPLFFEYSHTNKVFDSFDPKFRETLMLYLKYNPDHILAGSIALMIWGIIPIRKPKDIDVVKIEMTKKFESTSKGDVSNFIVKQKKKDSYGYGDDVTRDHDKFMDIDMCIFTSNNMEKYETIEYGGIMIKISYPENIIKAKIKYTSDIKNKSSFMFQKLKYNFHKHMLDIISYRMSPYFMLKNNLLKTKFNVSDAVITLV